MRLIGKTSSSYVRKILISRDKKPCETISRCKGHHAWQLYFLSSYLDARHFAGISSGGEVDKKDTSSTHTHTHIQCSCTISLKRDRPHCDRPRWNRAFQDGRKIIVYDYLVKCFISQTHRYPCFLPSNIYFTNI